MQILIDEDNNNWNVELKIENGKLFAYSTFDPDAEPYEIDLNRDRIDITLK